MTAHYWEKVVHDVFVEHQADLRASGAWKVDGIAGPDLTCAIHPMFAKDRWCEGRHTKWLASGVEFYDRMEPALRLATKLITTECMLPWWSHVACTNAVVDAATGKRYLKGNNFEHTRRGVEKTNEKLALLARKITLAFSPPDRESSEFNYGWTWDERTSYPYYDRIPLESWPRGQAQKNPNFPGRKLMPMSTLNYQFYSWMKEKYLKASMASKLRFWFARTTLVHEVAHAFYYIIEPRRIPPGDPYHQKADPYNELGSSWEEWCFGHLISPITEVNKRVVPAAPLVTYFETRFRDGQETKAWAGKVKSLLGVTFAAAQTTKGHIWKRLDYSRPNNIRMITRAVPMDWVAQWFRRSSWQRWDRLKVRDWVPPPLGLSFVVNLECVKGVVQCYVGLKDDESAIVKVETDERRHDWEQRGDYSQYEGSDGSGR